MSNTLVISVDAMGGDNAPESVIEGVSRVAAKDKDVFFFLFGDEERIKKLAEVYRLPDDRYKIHHTTDVVKGDAKPSVAVRSGRESSMWKAIMSVRNGYASAVVSAGNTGALMAMSKICLGTLRILAKIFIPYHSINSIITDATIHATKIVYTRGP